ncbi:MAG TPA: neutral zinc metallopeptidase [Kribbella sp.]|nr:neutral zinc metallopeptidase [Kribbella sp.]
MRAAVLAGLVLLILCGCERTLVVRPAATPMPTTAVSPTQKVVPSASSSVPDYESFEDTYLLHNKVYSAGQVPAVSCTLPDSALLTRKDVRQYSTAVLDCLQRAWKPVVERADVVYEPTKVYVVGDGDSTACGPFDEDDADAFYCDDNSDIYLGWQDQVADEDYDKIWSQTYLQFVMAHEFGHHVQQLVGISGYYDDRWDRTKGAAQLEQTRRHELQATCFAAAFLGANQETLHLYGERMDAYHDAAYVGDEDDPSVPRDHGSSKSTTYWSKAAFTAKSPSACNTWAAPSKRVS